MNPNEPTNNELSVKCAEIMGWKPEIREMYAGAKNVKGWGRNAHLHPGDPEREFTMFTETFPNYPEDLNAAFQLIEHLRKDGKVVAFGNWEIIVNWETHMVAEFVGPSLPRAICEAFLEVCSK